MNIKIALKLGIVSLLVVFWASGSLASESAGPGTLSADDWASVIKTYESQISDGGMTTVALHNLALARFKNREPEQAVAVWLAAWERDRKDVEILSGLHGSLQALSLSKEVLDLSAQGPWMSFVANQGRSGFKIVLKAAVALLAVGAVAAMWLLYSNRKPAALGVLIGLAFLWLGVGFWYKSLGSWGAVISPTGELLRSAPNAESAEVSRLKPGRPIYALGDIYQPWLFVLTSDGTAGWINALSVRIVPQS